MLRCDPICQSLIITTSACRMLRRATPFRSPIRNQLAYFDIDGPKSQYRFLRIFLLVPQCFSLRYFTQYPIILYCHHGIHVLPKIYRYEPFRINHSFSNHKISNSRIVECQCHFHIVRFFDYLCNTLARWPKSHNNVTPGPEIVPHGHIDFVVFQQMFRIWIACLYSPMRTLWHIAAVRIVANKIHASGEQYHYQSEIDRFFHNRKSIEGLMGSRLNIQSV